MAGQYSIEWMYCVLFAHSCRTVLARTGPGLGLPVFSEWERPVQTRRSDLVWMKRCAAVWADQSLALYTLQVPEVIPEIPGILSIKTSCYPGSEISSTSASNPRLLCALQWGLAGDEVADTVLDQAWGQYSTCSWMDKWMDRDIWMTVWEVANRGE